MTECHSAESDLGTVSAARLPKAPTGAVSRTGAGTATGAALREALALVRTLFGTGAGRLRATARAVAGILGTGCAVGFTATRGILAAGGAVRTAGRLLEYSRAESGSKCRTTGLDAYISVACEE